MNTISNDTLVKILFVDDEPNVLRALRRLFMDEDNYELFIADSGADGLLTLEEENDICVVISDYRMPEMNGVDFLSQVHDRWPDTIRIVLSGYADTAAVVEAINVGHIYKFIPKPWNDEELRINIANAVETSFLNQQNNQLTAELAQRNKELQQNNHDLEKAVEQRSEALELRSQVLHMAQEMLDSIPVPVIGIDTSDLIVQVNESANKMLSVQGSILGENAAQMLPDGLLAFLEQVKILGNSTDTITHAGQQFTAIGCYLSDDRQRGVVVTLLPLEER